MIYSVSEVSELTKLSKVSIYTRFKLKEIEPYLTKKQGVTYVTEEGLKIILSDLKNNTEFLKEEAPDIVKENKEELSFKEDYISTLKQQLEIKDIQLKEKDLQINSQLAAKDLQINNLNERLKQEQDLNKNNQILQLRQPQDIKALEEHFTELDTKLLDIKEQMQKRKDYQEQEQKGFFKKFFKKQT